MLISWPQLARVSTDMDLSHDQTSVVDASRNLACRCMLTVCRTRARSFVDRGHRWEENQHFIQVFERKQTRHKQTRSAVFCTLC